MSEVIEKVTHVDFIKALAKAHKIEPLKGADAVTYVPVNITFEPKTQRTHVPPSVEVRNRIEIIDPKTKEVTPLVYVKSSRAVKRNGFNELEEEIPQIFIENGALVLGAKDLLLYYHMEMSDENESKVGRDTKVRAKFRRVDKGKTASENLDEIYDLEYVLRLVREMSLDEIKVMAEKYKVNTNLSTEEIRYNLIIIAKKDPKDFIRQSPNPRDKMKMLVKDAVASKFLIYDGLTRTWSLEEKSLIEIEIGKNADEEIVEFLLSKAGKDAYKDVKSKLKGN